MKPLGQFRIDAGHPSLPGHFPGRPVVPGVVLLDAAFALILAGQPGRTVTAVPSVKFTRPVRPGQPVDVSCDAPDALAPPVQTRVAFTCAVDGQDVVRGSVTLGPLESPP